MGGGIAGGRGCTYFSAVLLTVFGDNWTILSDTAGAGLLFFFAVFSSAERPAFTLLSLQPLDDLLKCGAVDVLACTCSSELLPSARLPVGCGSKVDLVGVELASAANTKSGRLAPLLSTGLLCRALSVSSATLVELVLPSGWDTALWAECTL